MATAGTKRIIKNTIFLYFRQILIMLVSLYTVRVVLSVLGAEDYGIYNVVAGVVTMFGFLHGAMATASQRYFSFDLGKGDIEHLKTSFSVTLQIYLFLALVVLAVVETAGLWFVNTRLVIPVERMTAANWIFQGAVASFLCTLLSTPCLASIIAHEDVHVYAYVSIFEGALKLSGACLLFVLPYDRLIVYGFSVAFSSLIIALLYVFWCRRHYDECRFRFIKDMYLCKELVSYSGWNLFGGMVGIVKNQIVNILLNLRFGAVVSAARGIALQVNAAVISFSQNFSTALRPQIVKTYAANRSDEMLLLVFRGCKCTFFLVYVFALPLVLEMNMVLSLWLKNPPEHTVIFTRLALIDAAIDSVNYPLMALAQATGKIRLYQGIVGGILLLNLPVSWLLLKLGFPAYSVMVSAVVITLLAAIVRIFIVRLLTAFSLRKFVQKVIIPCLLVVLISAGLSCWILFLRRDSFFLHALAICACIGITGICILFLGLTRNERKSVIRAVKNKWSCRA